MVRSDLAHEIIKSKKIELPGIISKTENGKFGLTKITTEIKSEKAAKEIGKPVGSYSGIECDKALLFHEEVLSYISKALSETIKEFMAKTGTKTFNTILVIGLGNNTITADSLGPKVTEKLIPNEVVKIFTPSVMGKTGLRSFETIKAVTSAIKPDLIIIIDSLCSMDVARIGTTFQLNNTGITPGSGVNAGLDTITPKTLNAPIIALGVPMVAYAPDLYKNSKNKFLLNLHVVPKDIDLIVENSSKILFEALKQALPK